MSALFEAYPDLRFEIVGVPLTVEGRVGVQWLMRGTNTGSLRGNAEAIRGEIMNEARNAPYPPL